MTVLHHAIKISAPRAEVWRALSTVAGMRAWHLGTVDGEIVPGGVLRLEPGPELRFAWRTEQLDAERSIRQTCIEGPGSSAGKQLAITLSDLPDGRVLVQLSDGEWPDDAAHLPLCNTRWGEALSRLRDHLQQGAR